MQYTCVHLMAELMNSRNVCMRAACASVCVQRVQKMKCILVLCDVYIFCQYQKFHFHIIFFIINSKFITITYMYNNIKFVYFHFVYFHINVLYVNTGIIGNDYIYALTTILGNNKCMNH